MFFSFYW